jgi:hypothetical protein
MKNTHKLNQQQKGQIFQLCEKYIITCDTAVVPAGIAQLVRLVMG